MVGDKMSINTYIGHTADVGEKVCFLKNFRTGSSTIRKCKCCGEIIAVNKSKITILCTDSEERKHIGENIILSGDCDIICKID